MNKKDFFYSSDAMESLRSSMLARIRDLEEEVRLIRIKRDASQIAHTRLRLQRDQLADTLQCILTELVSIFPDRFQIGSDDPLRIRIIEALDPVIEEQQEA